MRPVVASSRDDARQSSSPTSHEVRDALEALLASPHLDASDRRRAFLRYIVEETLAGRADRLKGYSVAISVFGRDESFDSNTDPVVRLEARRLRRDLDSYYVDAGSRDRVRITIPKGAYVPSFEWNERGSGGPRPAPSPDAASADEADEADEAEGAKNAPALDGSGETADPAGPDAPPPFDAPASCDTPGTAETSDPRGAAVPMAAAAVAAMPPLPDGAPGHSRAAGLLRRRPVLFGGVAAAVVAAIAVLAALLLIAPSAPPQVAQRPAGTPGDRGEPGVVVLPFRSQGASEDGRFLAEGISQELIAQLMGFAGLRIYMQSPQIDAGAGGGSPARLGRDLGVAYVVTGSVGVEGENVRVFIQLFDAATSEVVWASGYNRPFAPGALMEMQRDLAVEIASALGQTYGVVNTAALEMRRPAETVSASIPSYVCVMQAYSYRRDFSRAAFGPALACLEEAVQRDPAYPDALAMLGWLHLDAGRWQYLPDVPREESYARAFDAASRAYALDPHNILALKALAAINHYMGRYEEGERLAREAVALNPHDPDALAQLGWRLAVRGKFEEGVPLIERAVARSISPPAWYTYLVAIDLYLKGDYEAMLDVARGTAGPDLGVGQALIAIAAGALHRPDLARTALKELASDRQLASDPAEYFRLNGATDEIVEAMVSGLARAREVAAQ